MSTFYFAFPFAALLGAAAVALASDPPKLHWLAAALRLSRGRHAVRGPVRRCLDAACRAGAAWLSKYAGRGPAATDGIEIVEPEPEADEDGTDPLTGPLSRRWVLADAALFAQVPTPAALAVDVMRSGVTASLPRITDELLAELDAQRVGAAA